MNSVGIDVSKGKSMIAVMRPFGEVVVSPYEVPHTDSELSELAKLLKNQDGETRVVMEFTGNYHAPMLGCSTTQGLMQCWCITLHRLAAISISEMLGGLICYALFHRSAFRNFA